MKTYFSKGGKLKVSQQLFDLFLKPFINYRLRQGDRTMAGIMDMFFHADTRTVRFAYADNDFRMPGRLAIAGNRAMVGIGERGVKKDDPLIIAVDGVTKRVDVQFDVDETEQVFWLNPTEYRTILDNVRFVD